MKNRSLWERLGRAWNSPALTSLFATTARSFAYFAPIPFINALFSVEFTALWLLIISFQSMTSMIIGNLPIILMQLISQRVARFPDGGTNIQTGRDDSLGDLIAGLKRTFFLLTLAWLFIAIVVGTPLIWRPLNMTGDLLTTSLVWFVFVFGAATRVMMLGYSTFLIGIGFIAKVRRIEGIAWCVGGVLTVLTMIFTRNLVVAMVTLQLPFVILMLIMRNLARENGWQVSESQGEDFSAFFADIFPRAWRGTLGIFGSYLTVYGSTLIYAQFGTSSSIATLAFIVSIFGMISQLSNSQTISALPRMSLVYARQDSAQLTGIASRVLFQTIILYFVLTTGAFYALWVFKFISPQSIPELPVSLWLMFSFATLATRYASFHLHFFTITNDVKWHIFQLLNMAAYFPLIWLLGPEKSSTYPIALGASMLFCAAPYSRFLTYKRFGFDFRDEIKTIVVIILASIASMTAYWLVQ